MDKKSQIKFIFYTVTIFLILFSLLAAIGWVPRVLKKEEGDSFRTLWDKAQKEAIERQLKTGALNPDRVVIDKIGVDTLVSNPNTTNIKTLDDYLLQGAVHFPGSGFVGEGNMFIFAHSTGYRVVNNQAFKAFNGLEKLSKGDLIKVYAGGEVYGYKVSSVTLADENRVLVQFDTANNKLTLSTCNSFGQKSERYVVEADFIGRI